MTEPLPLFALEVMESVTVKPEPKPPMTFWFVFERGIPMPDRDAIRHTCEWRPTAEELVRYLVEMYISMPPLARPQCHRLLTKEWLNAAARLIEEPTP